MTDLLQGIKEYWAENKLCFSDFSQEDAADLLKIMILKEIDLRYEDGFVHLAKVELLVKAFPNDGLLFKIYQQLLEKCNAIVITLNENNCKNVMERCFSDEPTTYESKDSYRTIYDVNNNKYLKQIIKNHPKEEGAIKGVIYL